MKKTYLSLILTILFIGCASKVYPPQINLKNYEVIGLITFDSNSDGNLAEYTTKEFLNSIRPSQKDVKIVELGTSQEVLQEFDFRTIQPVTIKEIGREYGLNSIIYGNLTISDVEPDISIRDLSLSGVNFKASVNAVLDVKLVETSSGATIWNVMAEDEEEVGQLGMRSTGNIKFNAQDPDKAYGKLVKNLVKKVTKDLRERRSIF